MGKLPNLEEAAEMLTSSSANTDEERHRTAWARGEVHPAAPDADYARWRQEKRAGTLDKSGLNGTIEKDSMVVPHSLDAKALNYDVKLPDGTYARRTEGTRITYVKVIAGSGRDRQIDMIQVLLDRYSGITETGQTKRKGIGYDDYFGESDKAELHWYEEPSVGRVEFKIKTKNGAWFIGDEY